MDDVDLPDTHRCVVCELLLPQGRSLCDECGELLNLPT